jgi:hypothetical protein
MAADATLHWEREFPEALPLSPLRQSFSPRRPAVRSLAEEEVSRLVHAGEQIAPDDCHAVVRAGSYGVAVRVPFDVVIEGAPGAWILGEGAGRVAQPFLGGRYLKISCGHRLFYSRRDYSLWLGPPPNTEHPGIRVWAGLQVVDYRDADPCEGEQRQFNTNIIIEPLAPARIAAGTVLAVVYLVPRAIQLMERS